MKIKTFTASGNHEALAMAKEVLGDDAVILSTETLSDGQVQITVGIDELDDISFNDNQDIEIKKLSPSSRYTDRLLRETLEYHDTLDLVKQRILSSVRKLSANKDIYDDRKLLEMSLKELYNFADILHNGTKCKVFMGPPGVGKSTAIAKLGAQAKMNNLHCCIISIDNVRAGANSQLEAFAKILEQDFYFCKTERNLYELLKKAETTYDLILIDTPGINPFIKEEVEKVEKWVEVIKGEGILVLSAGTNTYEAIEMAEIFTELGAKKFLPTRLDLTRRIGSLLSVAACCELGFCVGSVSANIANGISEITPSGLAKLILA